MIWNQLRPQTKNVDFVNQQATANYNLALVPIIKTMELLRGRPDLKEANNHLMDAFKILCLSVKSTNVARAERIRKDLQPKYKALCDIEASSSQLFGDTLQEAIKKLDGQKVQLTNTNSTPFLGKRGSGKHTHQKRPYKNTPQHSNNSWAERNRGNVQNKWHQNHHQRKHNNRQKH
jgi:hypothetical protein